MESIQDLIIKASDLEKYASSLMDISNIIQREIDTNEDMFSEDDKIKINELKSMLDGNNLDKVESLAKEYYKNK